MDSSTTRRVVLKGLVAAAGLTYFGASEGKSFCQGISAPPPGSTRPSDDLLVAPSGLPVPVPYTAAPGPEFVPPFRLTVASINAPVIYEHTPEAGPDETFFLVGNRMTPELLVWGSSGDEAAGQRWQAKIQFAHEHGLAATLPQIVEEGPLLAWVGNGSGWSRPIRLNVPEPWWCGPDVASPGDTVRIFGRNLARRPDYASAFVYLAVSGQPGLWLNVEETGKYSVTVRLPVKLESGNYDAWVHAGRGGALGWGGPVKLKVQARHRVASSIKKPIPSPAADQIFSLQRLLDEQLRWGGGTVLLGEGFFPFHGTLQIPKGVTLAGSGRTKTRLQLVHEAGSNFGPGEDAAAVWLSGDGASLEHLTVSGTHEVNLGVAVKSAETLVWVSGCRVEDVRISDIERKRKVNDVVNLVYKDNEGSEENGEGNYGVRLTRAVYAVVRDCEISARAPLYLSGVRQCSFISNALIPRTVGRNADGTIEGRNEVIEECIIEGNRIASPPGAGAGGPTNHRMIWLSTGHGSVSRNWIANNGVVSPDGAGAPIGAGQPRFGGIAGMDQNLGEMILFEANLRTMFFGKLAAGDRNGITLPNILPPTPAKLLGNMLVGEVADSRLLLAHDSEGNETPYLPPDKDDGGREPPISEYYVSVFAGTGQGQTRRVIKREGNRLIVDRPWNEPPTSDSVVAVGTGFYQNLIVENYTPDGMSGIQLWISCIENVIANNSIVRQRAPGIFLYANATTLASSMPRSYNRGIAPLFWNVVESNRTEECATGVIVFSGDEPGLPVEFPRALGNVIRHNSFIRNREEGVTLSAAEAPSKIAPGNTSPSVAGTVVEFNVVRDATIAYHANVGNDDAVIRRNHAYFWYPVNNSGSLPVAFQVDRPGASVIFEANSAEDKRGIEGRELIELKRAK